MAQKQGQKKEEKKEMGGLDRLVGHQAERCKKWKQKEEFAVDAKIWDYVYFGLAKLRDICSERTIVVGNSK